MRNVFLLFCLPAALTVCSGCRNIETPIPERRNLDQEAGMKILTAIKKQDFELFRTATGERAGVSDTENFRRSCQALESQYGKIVRWQFLTPLATPLVENQIWLVDFERSGSSGKIIVQQQLFQLIFGIVDNQRKLLGMRFL